MNGVLERVSLWRHGLKFFTRTNVRHEWTLASYHSPLSITWSWALWLSLGNAPFGWRGWAPVWWYGRSCGIRVPYLFHLRFSTQRQMLTADCAARWKRERSHASTTSLPRHP